MLSFESFEELLSKGFNKEFNVYINDKYFGVNIKKDSVYYVINQ